MVAVVHRPNTVDEFLSRAGAFLVAREAEHNLIFGICSSIKASPEIFGEDPPRFLVVTDDSGGVLAAGLRTPPHNQVLSHVEDLATVDAIVEALDGEELPGLLAPKEVADRFVAVWTSRSGIRARLSVAERIFRLARVVPPQPPAAGAWRLVDARDRDTIARWLIAFMEEAVPDELPPSDPLGAADRWIAGVGRIGYVWVDGDEVVSLVGVGGETPHGIRVGPVYTPPEHRGRGYATLLTAAATQDQLDRGRQFVFLFTDLANPTSNGIYASIGYEPVCDVDQYKFEVG